MTRAQLEARIGELKIICQCRWERLEACRRDLIPLQMRVTEAELFLAQAHTELQKLAELRDREKEAA